MVREKAIKRVSIFLFLVLFFSFRLHGQETQIYTYEQLESLLKQKNSKLLAAQYRVEAATQILQATGPHYWPDLAFYYRYFPNGISFQEGEIATKNWLTARLSFDLVKFFKIRSLKTEERQMDVHLAELVVQELEQDALFAFRNLYTHTLYKKIQTEHYARLCSTSQKILEIRRFQFDHQEALRSHILEAEMEVSQNTKLVQQFKGEFAIEKRKLAATLRISPDAFELKESFFIPFVPDQKLVMQSALNKSVQSRKSALVLQKEIARSNASSTSNLRLEPYIGYRLRELRQGQLESGPEIGVQVGIGLGYFTERSHQQKYLDAMAKALQLEDETARQEVLFQLNEVYNNLNTLKVAIQRAKEEFALNTENLRIEEAIARQGIEGIDSSPIKLLEMKADNVRLQNQVEERKTEYMDAYFRLMHLAGISWLDVLQFHKQTLVPQQESTTKALWIWDTSTLVMDKSIADALPAFCAAHQVNKVYLSLPGDIEKTLAGNPIFIRLLTGFHKNKIAVQALLGDPHWIFPNNRANLLEKVDAIIRFNQKYAPAKLISGLHLDIEPHTLAGWNSQKTPYTKKFIETLKAVNSTLQAENAHLPLEIDIPLQFGNLQQTLLQQLIAECDAITIMAYARKTADKIHEDADPLLKACTDTGKKYTIGLNIKDFTNKTEFDFMVEEVKQKFSSDANYAGIAVHNFSSWIRLVGER